MASWARLCADRDRDRDGDRVEKGSISECE